MFYKRLFEYIPVYCFYACKIEYIPIVESIPIVSNCYIQS